MKLNSYIPTKLTGIVDLIWEHEFPSPGKYTVLPSGKIELLFPIYHEIGLAAKKILPRDNPMNNYSCFLSGLHTKPLKMSFEKFHTFGIQMKPVAVKALFGMPLCEIRNYFVEGKIIMNDIQLMEDMLHRKSTFLERAHWFENFLLKKINETADLHIAIRLDYALKKYLAKRRHDTFKTIENLMGYSRTHTYRLFNDWFGVSAHSYQRLNQFIRTTESLHNKKSKLTDVGLDNGYYDQSHFIRSFREFADMTPREYRNQLTHLPGQLFS